MREQSELVKKLRGEADELKSLKIRKITAYKENNAVLFEFISDKSVSVETRKKIEAAVVGYLGGAFAEIKVDVSKIVADKELIKRDIEKFLKSEYLSSAYFLTNEVSVSEDGNGGFYFTLTVDENDGKYAAEEVVKSIEDELDKRFCEDIRGKVELVKSQSDFTELPSDDVDPSDYETVGIRTYRVKDVVRLFGDDTGEVAVYAADKDLVSGGATFAGKVLSKEERTAKSGKPFYVLEIEDPSGKISGKVFYSKEREKKLGKVSEGSVVIASGKLDVYNGYKSFVIRNLAFCEYPEDFVLKERDGKRAPERYSLVFPKQFDDVTQGNLFEIRKAPPSVMIGKKFVVVDIETTGVSYVAGDKITEIGGVRIEDGIITDYFQTLVNPEREISENITKLTGIDNEMVKDAPKFEEVVADLYKYCDGCTIVAHNLDFDYNFIKYMSKSSGYVFKNDAVDTLALSKEVLPRLRNHKLNTVCKYFNIEFQHHRALSDAHATAKMFIELISIKKNLPN